MINKRQYINQPVTITIRKGLYSEANYLSLGDNNLSARIMSQTLIRIQYSMRQRDTEVLGFKPITLQTYFTTNRSSQDRPDNKVHEYHKLLKMKKLLQETQQKMMNRIKLFRKSADKISKKRESDAKTLPRHQYTQSHPVLQWVKSRQEINTAQGKRKRQERTHQIQTEQTRLIAEKLLQQRLNNVRTLKEEKQRFKILMNQRKKIDMQRKLQSASTIRKKRINAKLIKQQLEHDRRSNFARQIAEKYDREREQFVELEQNLNALQVEEQEALLEWKKTVNGLNL